MLFLIKIMRKLGIKTTVTKDEIIDMQINKLSDAENIIRELAYGYQSRKRYNKLICKAYQYMSKYYKD